MSANQHKNKNKTTKPGDAKAGGNPRQTPSKHFETVSLLQYVHGKPSPNYSEWFRKCWTVGTLKFGVHMGHVMEQRRFKPGQNVKISSKILHGDDSPESGSDDESQSNHSKKPSASPPSSDSEDYECSSDSSSDDAEKKKHKRDLKKKRLVHWEKTKIKLQSQSNIVRDDIIKIRAQDPQIFAFLLSTMSVESQQVFRTIPNWDTAILMSADPYVLMYWINRYHFGAFNADKQVMEDDACDKFDNCMQLPDESLATFYDRWKDCLRQMEVLLVPLPSKLDELRRFKSHLDKNRYGKTIENIKLEKDSGLKVPKDVKEMIDYLLARFPVTVHTFSNAKMGSAFAAEIDSDSEEESDPSDKQQNKKKNQQHANKNKEKTADKTSAKTPSRPCKYCPDSVPESMKMHYDDKCPCVLAKDYLKYCTPAAEDSGAKKKEKKGDSSKKKDGEVMAVTLGVDVMYTVSPSDQTLINTLKGKSCSTLIGLDSYANMSLVYSRNIVSDIAPLDVHRSISGVTGNMTVKRSALLKEVDCRVFFNPNSRVNILSHSDVVKCPWLELDWHKLYSTYTVKNLRTGRVLYFKPINGCYICDLGIQNDHFDEPIVPSDGEAKVPIANVTATAVHSNLEPQTVSHSSSDSVSDDDSFEDALEPPDAGIEASTTADNVANGQDDSCAMQTAAERQEAIYPKHELDKTADVKNSSADQMVHHGTAGRATTAADVHRVDRAPGPEFTLIKRKKTRKKSAPVHQERSRSLWSRLPLLLVAIASIIMQVYIAVNQTITLPSKLAGNSAFLKESFLGRWTTAADFEFSFDGNALIQDDDDVTNTTKARVLQAIAIFPNGSHTGAVKIVALDTHKFVNNAPWTLVKIILHWANDNLNFISADPIQPEPAPDEFVIERCDRNQIISDGGDPLATVLHFAPLPTTNDFEIRFNENDRDTKNLDPAENDPGPTDHSNPPEVKTPPHRSATSQGGATAHGSATDPIVPTFPQPAPIHGCETRAPYVANKISTTIAAEQDRTATDILISGKLEKLLKNDIFEPQFANDPDATSEYSQFGKCKSTLEKYNHATIAADAGLVLENIVHMSTDTSCGILTDCEPLTGIIISQGNGAIFYKFDQQVIMNKPSTASELNGPSDRIHNNHTRYLLDGELELQTKSMSVDILTKTLQEDKLRRLLLNWP